LSRRYQGKDLRDGQQRSTSHNDSRQLFIETVWDQAMPPSSKGEDAKAALAGIGTALLDGEQDACALNESRADVTKPQPQRVSAEFPRPAAAG